MFLPKRIGVIFGGSSSEREVSLEGGRNVYNKLDRALFDPIPIFVDSSHKFWKISDALLLQNTTKDVESGLDGGGMLILYEQLKDYIDFAFIVGHGKYMEDGSLQGLLELLNIPYNGSGVLSSAIGMDKWMSRIFMNLSGIDTPKTVPVSRREWGNDREMILNRIKKEIGFPCFVKPTREGCSTALCQVENKENLPQAIEEAFKWDPIILVEEKLSGMEVTVSVLGNEVKEVLPPTETPWSKGNTYLTLEDKFLPGGAEMITPARLGEEMMEKVKNTAKTACEKLRFIGYPRVDMFVTDDKRIVVLEVNSLPGITPSTMIFHQAAEEGMSPGQFLTKIIELAVSAHNDKIGPLI